MGNGRACVSNLPSREYSMRSRFDKDHRALSLEHPSLPKHAPLLPVLQEIAQKKQRKLHEDITNRAFCSPQCVLNWTTPKGVACKFYLIGGPGDFRAELLCWSGNRMIARKQWQSYSLNATHEIRELLESISEWAQSLA